MARPPAPTKLKLLKGVAKERINQAEPLPSDMPIECPTWVPLFGKELWSQLAPDLIAKGVLTHWDVPLFGALCEQFAIYRQAVAQVRRDGVTVIGHRDALVKHPALQVSRDALANVVTLGARFGLTPSDRSKLSLHDDRGQEVGADLLTSGYS